MRVAGFGMNSRATAESLAAALAAAGPADALAALESHADRVAPLARGLGLPLVAIAAIAGIATPTQSGRSRAAHGTGSVAEAVALAAAGPGARIATPRVASPDRSATCAIAQADISRPQASGNRPGQPFPVSAGPKGAPLSQSRAP